MVAEVALTIEAMAVMPWWEVLALKGKPKPEVDTASEVSRWLSGRACVKSR